MHLEAESAVSIVVEGVIKMINDFHIDVFKENLQKPSYPLCMYR